MKTGLWNMDSGLAALPRPGMTDQVLRRREASMRRAGQIGAGEQRLQSRRAVWRAYDPMSPVAVRPRGCRDPGGIPTTQIGAARAASGLTATSGATGLSRAAEAASDAATPAARAGG